MRDLFETITPFLTQTIPSFFNETLFLITVFVQKAFDIVKPGMMLLLENLKFIQVLQWLFFIIVGIQLFSLFLSLFVLIKHQLLREIVRFLDEYWQWGHLRENILSLSLWVSSVSAYSYLFFLGKNIEDISLLDAFNTHLYASIFVEIGSLGLIGYSLYRLRENLLRTQETCVDLKKLKTFRSFKNKMRDWQQVDWMNRPWGQLPKMALNRLTHWAEGIVHQHISAQMKEALVIFFLVASLDYLFRMSVIFIALFVVKGRLFF